MAGGIESQLVELVTRLDHTRYQPHILCLYGPSARDLHFAPQVRNAHIPLYTPDLGWRSRDKARAITAILSTAWSVRPHLIQAEGYHANLLTRVARPFLPPTRLIGSVRGTHTPKQLMYERLSHRFCRQMVVNAPHLKTMLVKRSHVPASKVSYIPNGIDIQRFSSAHESTLRQQIVPDAQRIFLALGRISFEKSFHHAVEGFGVLKRRGLLPEHVRFIVAGPIQEAAAQQALDEAIHRYGLETVVIQYPETAHPEDFYHLCDVCLIYSPSRTPGEGLPSVIIEALASGRPVLVSDAANAAQVIADRTTGWVVPANDPQRLADTLQHILALPDDALVRMHHTCLQAVQEYSAERMVQRYTSLYERLYPFPA